MVEHDGNESLGVVWALHAALEIDVFDFVGL